MGIRRNCQVRNWEWDIQCVKKKRCYDERTFLTYADEFYSWTEFDKAGFIEMGSSILVKCFEPQSKGLWMNSKGLNVECTTHLSLITFNAS